MQKGTRNSDAEKLFLSHQTQLEVSKGHLEGESSTTATFFECEKEENFKTTSKESKFSSILRQPLFIEGGMLVTKFNV